MNEKKDGSRVYDAPTAAGWAEFMKTGWAPTPLQGNVPSTVIPFTRTRRENLSKSYVGTRLIIPAGAAKVRSNDTNYRFRAHSAFAWLTGITASDSVPDSVLVMEPEGSSHRSLLFIHPRSSRDTDEFFRNAEHGEFWIGRRMTKEETELRYGIEVRHLDTLEDFLKEEKQSLLLRGQDPAVDALVDINTDDEKAFLTHLSEARLIKDSYEIAEMQKAIDITIRGFADMVKVLPKASATAKGERVIEGAFFSRARLEGNDLGYDTIAASGAHACILHWIKNDGDVLPGDLILIDAGVEVESYYTADVTRTLPVNGKFSDAQRKIYQLVFDAQKAAYAVIKPGVKFSEVNAAAQKVMAEGLAELGVLPVSAEESLKPEAGHHRRWTVHGTSHHLGIDVHDCHQARKEHYSEGLIQEGMIFTVEPGLYIHPDDEIFPVEYRGIGVRIEDDILVTKDGCKILTETLPATIDGIEKWMTDLLR
jgi:Xaa-Pro aminopeptidase